MNNSEIASQIRGLLGVKRIPPDITLKDLATKVRIAISLTEEPSQYTEILGGCVSVIRYLEHCSEVRYQFVKTTFTGQKALQILVKVIKEQRNMVEVGKLFDYK